MPDVNHMVQQLKQYNPSTWVKSSQTVWHGSQSSTMPQEGEGDEGYDRSGDTGDFHHGFGSGFHVGTLHAAHLAERGQLGEGEGFIHPLHMSGTSLVSQQPQGSHDVPKRMVQSDDAANYGPLSHGQVREPAEALAAGHNIPYESELEDSGSVAFRSPRSNLKTWRESVLSDPKAAPWHKAMAEKGYDLSIRQNDPDRTVPHPPQHEDPQNEEWAKAGNYWENIYAPRPSPKLRKIT